MKILMTCLMTTIFARKQVSGIALVRQNVHLHNTINVASTNQNVPHYLRAHPPLRCRRADPNRSPYGLDLFGALPSQHHEIILLRHLIC
jgi:hypothetical protein